METEGRLLQQIELDNGLTMFLHDQSKPIVGNRWQLKLQITVPIIIKAEYFAKCEDPQQAFRELTDALGSTLQFTLEKVRNFVDESKFAELMEQMTRDFLQSSQAYIASVNFAEKFTLKKYAEWKEEEIWQRNRRETIKETEQKG